MNKFLKRTFDIIASALLLIVFLPLFVVFAIIIKCDSKGPVFFKQRRRTKGGRIFMMYKFRSMVTDAEKMGAGLFNYKDDPRVTKVGRFMRNTSIDELPQLWNVLIGDISIVGPRPCVENELGDFDTLNSRYKKRFEMRGGITGLAQIMGRNANLWDQKVTYDNEYIDRFKKQGIFLDMKILCLTVARVFKKQDIYEEKVGDDVSDEESARLAEEEIIRTAHLPDNEKAEEKI